MNNIYFYIGLVVFWAILVSIVLYIAYITSIVVIEYCKIFINSNFFQFYIMRKRLSTDQLRKYYKMNFRKKNKKYILLNRLYNIENKKV